MVDQRQASKDPSAALLGLQKELSALASRWLSPRQVCTTPATLALPERGRRSALIEPLIGSFVRLAWPAPKPEKVAQDQAKGWQVTEPRNCTQSGAHTLFSPSFSRSNSHPRLSSGSLTKSKPESRLISFLLSLSLSLVLLCLLFLFSLSLSLDLSSNRVSFVPFL